MAVKIESIDILKKYFLGVITRTDDHAPNIDNIVYSLLGIVILLKDDNTHLEVRGTDDNSMGNILWVIINGTRFALRYEHLDGTIEIRQNSFKGRLILKINNLTSITEILKALK
ncbi:MAG TPA: hypothetical protein VK151_00895 [Fluviicola sp.]|nr:hypothetical protein [Fluviicola sp.]